MAGIYIHIPFCKQACSYCNFHFSTSRGMYENMVDSLLKEMALRRNYPGNENISSVYFGGGTPSILKNDDLLRLMDTLALLFPVEANAEITLEANPDDLSAPKLKDLKNAGINRLSIGIQSFHDEDLAYMNRAHTTNEALSSIMRSQDAGFENLTIDLIYGSPTTTHNMWEQNIAQSIELQVPHISSYCLTIEPKTALSYKIAKGDGPAPDEEIAAQQFLTLMDKMEAHGFEHYEISNFCLPGKRAMHNSSYWNRSKYLGIGPSAHSFNGESRQWNVANNSKYIEALQKGSLNCEMEQLSVADRINEYIMTSLRTSWGLNLDKLTAEFSDWPVDTILKEARPFIDEGKVMKSGSVLTLTRTGKLFADKIASALFMEDD